MAQSDQPSLPPVDADLAAARKHATPAAAQLLYGGYLLLSIAAAVLSWERIPSALFGVGAAVLILATMVSLLTRSLSRANAVAARAALWGVLVLTTFLVALFISSAFFGMPERGAIIAARVLGENSLAIVGIQKVPVILQGNSAVLPTWVSEEPTGSADRFERIAALSHLPPIIIRGTTVSANGPSSATTTRPLARTPS